MYRFFLKVAFRNGKIILFIEPPKEMNEPRTPDGLFSRAAAGVVPDGFASAILGVLAAAAGAEDDEMCVVVCVACGMKMPSAPGTLFLLAFRWNVLTFFVSSFSACEVRKRRWRIAAAASISAADALLSISCGRSTVYHGQPQRRRRCSV